MWATASMVLAVAGCRATVGPQDGAVEQATRVSELESEVAALKVRLAEATARLDAIRDAGHESRPTDLAVVPRPELIVEATGSSVRPGPATTPGSPATLQWRVRTEDARGRFVQSTGPAEVVAATIADDGSAVELGRWTITAERWRDSLREGLLGTAYAIDLPIAALPSDAQFLLVRLVLEDVRQEEPLRFESPVPVVRPLAEGDR